MMLEASSGTHLAAFSRQACDRILVTRDLDLSEAIYVQFYACLGCHHRPMHRDAGVLVDYSWNGGVEWTNLGELFYDQYYHSR